MFFRRIFIALFACSLLLVSPSALPAAPTALQAQLLTAARQGKLSRVKQLLAKGAKINPKVNPDANDTTPLIAAAENGRIDVVKFLVAHGANIKATTTLRAGLLTALFLAKNYGCVKALLDAGADPNDADVDGESVLTRWLERGDKESVRTARLLISHGANVNCGYEGGGTGLMSAVEGGNAGIVRLMLSKGATVNDKDDGDQTALSIAKRNHRPDLVRMLRQAGAKK